MTDYQMNLTIDAYFNKLIDMKIPETKVEDMYQKNGILHIILDDKTIIQQKIKNFNN